MWPYFGAKARRADHAGTRMRSNANGSIRVAHGDGMTFLRPPSSSCRAPRCGQLCRGLRRHVGRPRRLVGGDAPAPSLEGRGQRRRRAERCRRRHQRADGRGQRHRRAEGRRISHHPQDAGSTPPPPDGGAGCGPVQLGANASLGAARLFPDDNPWNSDISTDPSIRTTRRSSRAWGVHAAAPRLRRALQRRAERHPVRRRRPDAASGADHVHRLR